MKILAVSNETVFLRKLKDIIGKICPYAEVVVSKNLFEFLEPSPGHDYEIVFFDVHTDGMRYVMKLKEVMPRVNIIFVASSNVYTAEALAVHASGYIKKPVTQEKIKKEMEDLRYPVSACIKPGALLKVRCFGNFEVFMPDGGILHFERSKAKELFACLVNRQGASCTVREIAGVLFEDKFYDKKQKNYLQKIISSMMQSLRLAGAEKTVIKSYNSIAVNTGLIDCDYYHFMRQDSLSAGMYKGEYMSQYSWAEFVNGYLDNIYKAIDNRA